MDDHVSRLLITSQLKIFELDISLVDPTTVPDLKKEPSCVCAVGQQARVMDQQWQVDTIVQELL